MIAGVTQPVRGKIAAVLKADGAEVPTCVYNELVAARLQAATLGGRLHPSLAPRAGKAVWRCPYVRVWVLVADLFIGNWGRGGNNKASVATPAECSCTFDHSHALLSLRETLEASIETLSRLDSAIGRHVFKGLVGPELAHWWALRIAALAHEAIESAFCPGAVVNMVAKTLQRQLERTLIRRKAHLPDLVAQFLDEVSA